jgi:predicted nucleotidyltransferase
MELPDFHGLAERLRQDYGAQKIWLYGSHARGTAGEDSDVDLLVISPTTEKFFDRMATVRRLLRKQRRGFPISPIVLTPEELENRLRLGDQFFEGIVRQGLEI